MPKAAGAKKSQVKKKQTPSPASAQNARPAQPSQETPRDQLVQLQKTLGNRAVGRLLESGALQPPPPAGGPVSPVPSLLKQSAGSPSAGVQRQRPASRARQLSEADIQTAVRFNSRLYQGKSIRILGDSLYVLGASSFTKDLILKIAQAQARWHIRVDGQVGPGTLGKIVTNLVRKRTHTSVNNAIWLVVDAYGYHVSKVKSITYDPGITGAAYSISGSQIGIGPNALRNFGTLKRTLKEAIHTVQTQPKERPKKETAPEPAETTPSALSEKQRLKLVDRHWDSIKAGTTWRPPPGVSVEELLKEKQACENWWKSAKGGGEFRRLIRQKFKSSDFYSVAGENRVFITIGWKHKGKFQLWNQGLADVQYGPELIIRMKRAALQVGGYRWKEEELKRDKKVRTLHQDRIRGVGSWSRQELKQEWANYVAWTNRADVKATVKELLKRGFTVAMPYGGQPAYTFPMCDMPIIKGGEVRISARPYYRILGRLKEELLRERRAEGKKRLDEQGLLEVIRQIRKRHGGKLTKYMRQVVDWTTEGRSGNWDQYIALGDIPDNLKAPARVRSTSGMAQVIKGRTRVGLTEKGLTDAEIAESYNSVWSQAREAVAKVRMKLQLHGSEYKPMANWLIDNRKANTVLFLLVKHDLSLDQRILGWLRSKAKSFYQYITGQV